MTKCDWYKNWFDSPYYHLLYQHRDDSEAERFITNLVHYCKFQSNARILDLACGKGRHSFMLWKHGFTVTGMDLSANSIADASKEKHERLNFIVQDMRESFGKEKYDVVVNLFTSFGYFEKTDDDLKVLKNIALSLTKGGLLILDYLNSDKIKLCIAPSGNALVNGIDFKWTKKIEGDFVVKKIEFSDNGSNHVYEERVKLISKAWFEKALMDTGFKIETVLGNYDLAPFTADSDRLILLARKIN